MIKAEWGTDYDCRNDKCFERPMHVEECYAPVYYDEEAKKYVCIGCGEEAEVDEEMKEWIEARRGEKVETEKCFKCGQNTFQAHYHKNERTLEWQLGYGECTSCGMSMIV